MTSEARRHHYIPQFILRNFINNKLLNYYDLNSKNLSREETKEKFMNIDMYRDEVNHSDNPTIIESTLSTLECCVSKIINNKILKNNEFIITRLELETLRIYITLQAFRDDYRKQQYINKNFDNDTYQILSKYAINDDFEDLWKREIEAIASCRSIDDIIDNDVIDPIIKQDFINDLKGQYMTVVEARGGEFLISDVYPCMEVYRINGIQIHLHFIMPISPNRLILLNHIMFSDEANNLPEDLEIMKESSKIKGNMIKKCSNRYKKLGFYSNEDEYIYKVNKIYQNDVKYINYLTLNEARKGIIFKDKEKIIDSLYFYQEQEQKNNDYSELIKLID